MMDCRAKGCTSSMLSKNKLDVNPVMLDTSHIKDQRSNCSRSLTFTFIFEIHMMKFFHYKTSVN